MVPDDEYYKELLESHTDPSSPCSWFDQLELVNGTIDDLDVVCTQTSTHCEHQVFDAWSTRENEQLDRLAKKHRKNWTVIVKYFPGRTCRELEEHWTDRRESTHKRPRWSSVEDQIIIDLYIKHGADWKLMANQLEGRYPDTIKNRFYGTIKKRLSPEQQKQVKKSQQLHRKAHQLLLPPLTYEDTPENQDKLIESMLVGLADDWEFPVFSKEATGSLTSEQKQTKLQELLRLSAVYETLILKTQEELAELKK